MKTKYSKVNGVAGNNAMANLNEKEDDASDVNYLSEAEQNRIIKNPKTLKNFLKSSRKINGTLFENESLSINKQNSVMKQSFDLSTMVNSNHDLNATRKQSKNVCLIEESPFYIHKVKSLFFFLSLKSLNNADLISGCSIGSTGRVQAFI